MVLFHFIYETGKTTKLNNNNKDQHNKYNFLLTNNRDHKCDLMEVKLDRRIQRFLVYNDEPLNSKTKIS